MQSFIILHSQRPQRDTYLETFFQTHTINKFDQQHISGLTSIGIEEIRLMQKQLYLKPRYGQEKAIIMHDAQNLTIEAQNALLKILEEPPVHTYFFLSSNSLDPLLPTILSRCSVVVIPEEMQALSDEQKRTMEHDLEQVQSETINDRLILAEQLTTANTSPEEWIARFTQYLREKMLQATPSEHAAFWKVLTNLQEANRLLKTTNANPRAIIEHTFLSC